MIPRLMLAGLVAASEQAITAGMRAADIQPQQLAPMVGKILKLRITDLISMFGLFVANRSGGSLLSLKKPPMSNYQERSEAWLKLHDR